MQTILTKQNLLYIRNWIEENYIIKLKEAVKEEYGFDFKLAGSAAKNLVVTDNDGNFDMDFQLIISPKSQGDCNDATYIKNLFFDKLRTLNIKAENSKTAITLTGFTFEENLKFSVDFVILRFANIPTERIKRNISNNDTNAYTWGPLPSRYVTFYDKLNGLSADDKNKLRTYIMVAKTKEKSKPDSQMSGFEVFLNIINNKVKNGKVE
jgi:hypothetical protein